MSYCCVFSSFHQPDQGNYGTVAGYVCLCVCRGVVFALNSSGKNLKSLRLILSEAFRISTLYFISIYEKSCHTAFASSYLLQLMFNSIQFNFINPHGGNWFKGKKSASDNKIRDIKTESWWGRGRERRSKCILQSQLFVKTRVKSSLCGLCFQGC